MKVSSALLTLLLGIALQSPALAQENPEAVYKKWVEASKAGDVEALLAISSKPKVDEFHQEFTTPEKIAEIKKIMKLMAPISYKIQEQKISTDGNRATLKGQVVALDFFKMNDPKAKPEKDALEVKLVKEAGQWKIDKQCTGPGGCGQEPDWTEASWGKTLDLGGGATLKVIQGKPGVFKGVKTHGKAVAVELQITLSQEGGETFSYFLHRSESFAEFYLLNDGKKIAPVARLEEFLSASEGQGREKDLKVLEDDTSYSRSTSFQGTGKLSLLFDLPKDVKGLPPFYLTVGYGEKKFSYEVK